MLVRLLDHFIQNISIIALLTSFGLLILICNRDAFELDSKLREEHDPLGGNRSVWQFKHSSDFGEHARLELLHLIRVLKVATTTLVIVAILMFLVVSLVEVLGWFGLTEIRNWWENNSYISLVFNHGLGLLILAIGPIMLYRLARVVSDVVRAREIPDANKQAGWAP